MDRSSFTKRLSELMAERGWTGYRLSKKSGVAKSTIYRVLQGKNEVKYETMQRLINAFEMPNPSFWGYIIQLDFSDVFPCANTWKYYRAYGQVKKRIKQKANE